MNILQKNLNYIASLVFNDLQDLIYEVSIDLGIDHHSIDSFDSLLEKIETSSSIDINSEEQIENISNKIASIAEIQDLYNHLI